MKQLYFFLLLIIMFPEAYLSAQQEGRKDSIWVSNRLGEGDTLRINPEFMRAIQSGTLINPGLTEQQQLHSHPDLPILKDFSEYLQSDSIRNTLAYDSLPPAVFFLYSPESENGWLIDNTAYSSSKSLIVKDRFKMGNLPLFLSGGSQNLFLKEVKDGQRRGSVGGTATFEFSLEDALRYVFMKSERDKRRNRKREFTWKHYNSYP